MQEKREKREKERCAHLVESHSASEPRDASLKWLPRESEDGNVEYKLRLKDPSPARLQQLVRCALTSRPCCSFVPPA